MKKPRLAPLGCALLLAFAAPAQAWTVKDASNNTQLKLTDDGNLGVGTASPGARLEVAGAVKIGNDTGACNTAKAGSIRWTGSVFECCAGGTAWTGCMGGGGLSSSPAGQAVIDLGSYGKLIKPVKVDGKWFYYWDRSGDGTSNNSGSLNGGVDYTTHDVLDGIFNKDASGAACGGGNTTDNCRYATLNGVKLALPTAGTSLINAYLSDNQTYTDLAEIWDTYNSGYQTAGAPSGWQLSTYWSATPSSSGHAGVYLTYGYVGDHSDSSNTYVAVQVF